MKRTRKPVFFIVLLLILGLTYTSFFGIYTNYGDRRDTKIRGAADIRFGIDVRGGVEATFGSAEKDLKVTEEQLSSVESILSQRLILNNITDYELYVDQANAQVIVRYPWSSDETDFDAASAIEELGRTATLEFRYGDDYSTDTDDEGNTTHTPTGELVLTGDDVDEATAIFTQESSTSTSQTPAVQLKLKDSGKKKFADATAKALAASECISIWLDGQMLSAPSVKAHITDGVAVISGSYETYADAVSDANLITSGALPFALEVKGSNNVSPTMGEKALDVMVLAGIIAFALVVIFMIVVYRLPGFVASIALLGQLAGAIACISGYFGVFESFTLTIPGMTGIILSIGMGVDANVIYAERIKEEIRRGRTIDGAIDRGGKGSFWAIFDGNISVIIVAVVLMGVFGPSTSFFAKLLSWALYWFPVSSTGSVYSFGYTLLIGVVFNFIMAVWASRKMLGSLCRFKAFRKPWLLGGDRT